jgi:hypothetical protein
LGVAVCRELYGIRGQICRIHTKTYLLAVFWKTAIAEADPNCVYPIRAKRFHIEAGARIATAGSCFAQEVGKYLAKTPGVELLLAETTNQDQPLFSALYLNVYTVEQLLQLFDRAFGTFVPVDQAWQRSDGRYIDPFRPYVFPTGFSTGRDVLDARVSHLDRVRRVFSECSIFVFTLGLTESWRSKNDGAVFPVAPGVVDAQVDHSRYQFHNFKYAEVVASLRAFVTRLRSVNPPVRIILTVSPVPLIATYTPEHVLVAITYSKSVLLLACHKLEAEFRCVHYFPSYEIVSGAFTRASYYNNNLRTVTKAGVDHVMETFRRTYLSGSPLIAEVSSDPPICEEEEIVHSIGFD